MGGVEVLRPQDLLNNNNRHHNFIYPVRKTHHFRRNPLPHPASSTVNRSSNRRKRSPPKNTFSNNDNRTIKPHTSTNNTPLIGQVKILKRGEALPVSTTPPTSDLKVEKKNQQQDQKTTTTSKKKIGSFDDGVSQVVSAVELAVLPKKQIQISDCYAGWAFVSSPPPSSLPVPAFFKKKNLGLTDDNNSNINDEATSDIRKLLRLDLS